jgi:hypothetical protein
VFVVSVPDAHQLKQGTCGACCAAHAHTMMLWCVLGHTSYQHIVMHLAREEEVDVPISLDAEAKEK